MKTTIKFSLLCASALFVGLYLQLFGFNLPLKWTSDSPPEIAGFFWPEQKALESFSMLNQDNQLISLESLNGRWSLLFFGYTYCPDICPITMHTLKQVDEQLDRSDINYLFVSVDGKRDTPQQLKSYLSYFGSDFKGLTGDESQIQSLTNQLGIPYSIDPHEPGELNYLVNHTGALFLVSPQATLVAILQPPHEVNKLASELKRIISFSNSAN